MFVRLSLLAAHVPVLISILCAIILFRRLDQPLKAFAYFLLFSGLIQLVSLFFWFKGWNNLLFSHIYVPLGFALLTLFYAQVLKGFINSLILYVISGLFIIFCVLSSIYWQTLKVYNSYALTVETVLIVIYTLSTFIFMLNSIFKETKAELVISLNLINSGLFIYYASSLIIFYFGSDLAIYKPSLLAQYAWLLHAFFSVVMYTLFIIGLWKRPKT